MGLELTRSGTRSTFGEVRVYRAGVKDPIGVQRAVAVYTELGQRSVTIPIDPAWHVDHMSVVAFLQDPKSLEIYTSAARNVAQ